VAEPGVPVATRPRREAEREAPLEPDLNIHSPSDFERDYSGRNWRFYRDLVAECVARAEPGPILDVGAGLGFFVEACQRYGLRCTGLEGSDYAVRLARGRYPVDMRQHYLSRPWPFSEGTFSVVVCNQTIEHLTPTTAEIVLRESFRVLRPGGLLIIASPCLHDPVQAAEATHINLYTPKRLRAAVNAAGFRDYRANDSPRLLLGASRPMEALLKIVFRLMPLDFLSVSANCFAHKPLGGPSPAGD
jgi:SAM-dependent methyltransferase